MESHRQHEAARFPTVSDAPTADRAERAEEAPASEARPLASLPSGAPTSERRALTRAQFEAAAKGLRHGTSGHLAFGCPQCSDPMKGLVEDSALLNGPAEVWN